jgi:hypothetical protein
MKFVPDAPVGPQGAILAGRDLQIEPRELRRAHAVQREPVIVVRVDELIVRRLGLRQDAQPSKRIRALEDRQVTLRHRLPAHAMKAVAPYDEVACERVIAAPVRIVNRRLAGLEAVRPCVRRFEQDRPVVGQACLDQVLHDFLLAVHHDRAAAGPVMENRSCD